ncbi:MAG: 30S ribosomal protein S2 [Crocinitomicaceae bacterium]|nr:30S ribosomal protein S2 [Crocinitomicaceae bacterium]|tara:strand:- start:953 stop:1741 length:789 start_codon:yes stop_codon:yes gene_type:complete
MGKVTFEEMLNAGVHFGHLRRKWNPNMSPYIFDEKKGIHIIDLNKTLVKLDEAANAMKQIAKSGRKILFVATKKQAKEIISSKVEEINMPSITERWPGGMLTNFKTTRKTVKKMSSIDKMMKDGTADTMSKRERLQLTRQREKIGKVFGSISDMNRLPAAIFIVDVKKEHIALAEARNLNIPVFAMVDTNSNPNDIDFVIPSNDDATKSIDLIISNLCDAIKEGLGERKQNKDKVAQEKAAKEAKAAESAESAEKTTEEVKS